VTGFEMLRARCAHARVGDPGRSLFDAPSSTNLQMPGGDDYSGPTQVARCGVVAVTAESISEAIFTSRNKSAHSVQDCGTSVHFNVRGFRVKPHISRRGRNVR
jgi:hypothetical protein